MKAFYERSLEDRISLTEDAIRSRETIFARWMALEDKESKPWSARSVVAAAWLESQTSVVDLGCGLMKLRAYLKEDQIYIPVDVIARDEDTIVCDLNTEDLPEIEATSVAALGLLEYIHDVEGLLTRLSCRHDVLVVSYCVVDASQSMTTARRGHGWVNDYSSEELEHVFRSCGWRIEDSRLIDSLQRLWQLRSMRGES